jgi:hypothetical protein
VVVVSDVAGRRTLGPLRPFRSLAGTSP